MARDANEVAAKWAQRTAGAGEAYASGIRNARRDPMQAAKAAKATYVARVQEAAANGKYERGLDRVTRAEWERASIEKGQSRLASGAQASQGKMGDFMGKFLPHAEQVSQQVRGMPNATMEDRLNRMVANARGNAKFKYTR